MATYRQSSTIPKLSQSVKIVGGGYVMILQCEIL